MKFSIPIFLTSALLGIGLITGCNSGGTSGGVSSVPSSTNKPTSQEPPPKFSLAWSEYPSWSVFGVADEEGIINLKEGEQGDVEKKWNVDIVLNQADYDTCIQQYGNSTADAVCITNMDILAPSASRPAVAILPTSTSVGADACITVGINNIDALKGIATHGLEKSVSQYCFERVLEIEGKNPSDFPFQMMDPGTAATGMQSSQADIKSIMVWNPFVMQTLRSRKDSKVLFDSSKIPEEIIDMVVVAKDSLAKPGGKRFAYAVLDTFYAVNKLLADPKEGDRVLVALGAKFSSLPLQDMQLVVKQTSFYKTPEDALKLLEGDKFRKETMPHVVNFSTSHGICESKPTVGFGDPGAQLNITSEFLLGMRDGITPDKVP